MAETVATKPYFREGYQKRRCIVPVDGFFEWMAVKGSKTKQPYAAGTSTLDRTDGVIRLKREPRPGAEWSGVRSHPPQVPFQSRLSIGSTRRIGWRVIWQRLRRRLRQHDVRGRRGALRAGRPGWALNSRRWSKGQSRTVESEKHVPGASTQAADQESQESLSRLPGGYGRLLGPDNRRASKVTVGIVLARTRGT